MMEIRRILNFSRRLLAVALAAVCLPMAPAEAESPKAGEPAPLLSELRAADTEQASDRPSTAPLVLLFVKKDDNYSARVITQLKELAQRNAELFRDVHVRVVLSRINAVAGFDESVIPEDWTLVKDTEDTFYTAYRIIATPTAVVVGGDGNVRGFHAGYSPGLVRLVQRDLLLDLRGRDALHTAAPPVNMELQMARRLAERGLWERALTYYRSAAEKEPLDPQSLLEMARVLVEVRQIDEALEVLDGLDDSVEVDDLRQRAKAVQTEREGATSPDAP